MTKYVGKSLVGILVSGTHTKHSVHALSVPSITCSHWQATENLSASLAFYSCTTFVAPSPEIYHSKHRLSIAPWLLVSS